MRPLPPNDGGPHALVSSVEAPVLDDHDRHHLERSLRLRPGDALTVTDGDGRWRSCRLGRDGLTVDGPIIVVDRPTPALTVGLALTKAGKPELAVQKLTELGIDRICVFTAERSVARWDQPKTRRQHQRLERVVREALMQSRGVFLPIIEVGGHLADVAGPAVALADRFGPPIGPAITTLVIGPEGGWSAAERDLVKGRAGLGPNVLRSETAAIAAATLMVGVRSGVVLPGR